MDGPSQRALRTAFESPLARNVVRHDRGARTWLRSNSIKKGVGDSLSTLNRGNQQREQVTAGRENVPPSHVRPSGTSTSKSSPGRIRTCDLMLRRTSLECPISRVFPYLREFVPESSGVGKARNGRFRDEDGTKVEPTVP